jgi:hypothetical protein
MASLPPLLRGSVYAKQEELISETPPLPVMNCPDGSEIRQGNFSVGNVTPTSRLQVLNGPVRWTNDADDSLSKTSTWTYRRDNACSVYLKPDQPFTTKYTYVCRQHYFGYSPPQPFNREHYDFTITTPDYSRIPYEYIHMVTIMSRRMNVFNMYISDRLSQLLEAEYIAWLRRKFATIALRRNSLNGIDGLGQIIHHSPKYGERHGDLKIQMCVYPRYLCWVLETLFMNLPELYARGVDAFKFGFLHGEDRINNLAEIYPTIQPGQTVEEYTVIENGEPKQYKREQLFMPNIVFYLLDSVGNNAKPLIDMLVALFPDEFEISCDIPRANIRVSNNVSFSVGGGNVEKYDNPALQRIPFEYGKIINTPALHSSHQMFSRYLTGHTLINEDLTVNNIASYKMCVGQYPSFKSIFERYNLMEYYMGICGKLGIDEAVMNSVTGGKTKKNKRKQKKKKSRRY